MSQLALRLESYSAQDLRDLMETQGRELFIRQVAILGDIANDQFVQKLEAILGPQGIEALEEALEAIERGEDPFPQLVQSAEELTAREMCATAMEGVPNMGETYANALRGKMEISPGIKTLVWMLKDQRILSKWKGQRGERTAIRLALESAITTQAKEAAARRKWAKEEVDRLLYLFKTACASKNLRDMEKSLKGLRNAHLQAALVKKMRGVVNRNAMFTAFQKTIDEVFKVRTGT